jgi:hypothetical protein
MKKCVGYIPVLHLCTCELVRNLPGVKSNYSLIASQSLLPQSYMVVHVL